METVLCPIDVNDPEIAVAVLILQRMAYRIEAALIGFEQIPPLHESLDDLVAAPLLWRGVVESGEIVAAMGFTEDDGQIDIDRLFVSPRSSRKGYGSALVASLGPTATITVSTGTKNVPARRLYEAQGFVKRGESSPVPGLRVTHYLRKGIQ